MEAALSLFSTHGITLTTTKEIAETAGVNEVTLFRQFGSKQGLLLAVMQAASIPDLMQVALSAVEETSDPVGAYGQVGLSLLGRVPDLVRSLVGESAQFPEESRQALGDTLQQINLQTMDYLRSADVSVPGTDVASLARLVNTLLVGYSVLDSSSGGEGLWPGEADFLRAMSALIHGQTATQEVSKVVSQVESPRAMADLPAEVVRSLFLKAKKIGVREHALVYVLFGAGLRASEVVGMVRSQIFASKTQLLLRVAGAHARQVPVNRWIMGYRYGTYVKNPLTQWLKSRQDERAEVFVGENGEPMDGDAIAALWGEIAEGVMTFTGEAAAMEHARHTWCIEQLVKGMTRENLSLLAGMDLELMVPFEQRAREKAALAQALEIDQKRDG